jgi:FkbM family methyltransferase
MSRTRSHIKRLEEDDVKQLDKRYQCLLTTVVIVSGLFAAACDSPEKSPVPLASFIESENKLYSQDFEELLIRHFFADRRSGFFLDVGAFEWKAASTTLYLEHHLGWKGIAIDANPKYAMGYRNNRPNSEFLNYYVSDRSGESQTLLVAGPLSSSSEAHIRSFPGLKDIDLPRIEVPTITLNDLLDQRNLTKIDFLSMDIELGEPAALAGFDIERFRPDLVCIEASGSVRDQLTSYFDAHGYERIDEYLAYDSVNWYFRPVASE